MISVDTELLEAFPCYSSYGNGSVERVRFVLMKLDSDYKHDTDYFGHKFMSKVESIFNGLPKPKDWRSLYNNDLPLLTTIDDEVQAVAVHRSNNQNRDATPGQKAMATAMAFPEAKRGRGNIDPSKCDSESHFSQKTLERARYVLRNSPMMEGERYPRRCLSTNVHRRHLTKGQQAMAVALAYPNPEQGKRETSLKIKEVGINAGYISQARFIIRHCLDKAEEVLLNPNYTLNKRGSLCNR